MFLRNDLRFMKTNIFRITILVIFFSFVIRFINLGFPIFTNEEARIAHRAYTLVNTGRDELGRKYPLIFNALDDYQLPLVSYITMTGVAIFGKTDLGVRIPFVLIGTLLVFLMFKISKFFSTDFKFRYISAFIVATSPVLAYLSKIPNDAIVLTLLFVLLFYLITNNKNAVIIILTMVLAALTSKFTWFILLPFIFYTIWLSKLSIRSKKGYFLLGASLLITVIAFLLFLNIPQSRRSLLENNFSILSDITIQNGVNRLRGQGMQSNWPPPVDRLLFNKLNFLIVGLLHWTSHLNLTILFGQFDEMGKLGFSYLGAWVKILIVPFFLGLYLIIKKEDQRAKKLLFLPFLLTFPSIFIYPNFTIELIVVTLPFIAILISFGCLHIIQNRKWLALGLFLITFELLINMLNVAPEYKNTNNLRPNWIAEIVKDVFRSSINNQIAVSDDIVSDIVPFIGWYSSQGSNISILDINWPYKYRQYDLTNIKVIGSQEKFRTCGIEEKITLYASKRDFSKIEKFIVAKVIRIYKDSLGEERVYLIEEKACLN